MCKIRDKVVYHEFSLYVVDWSISTVKLTVPRSFIV